QRSLGGVRFLARHGPRLARLAQCLDRLLQRSLARGDGVTGPSQLPLQLLDLRADGVAQDLQPGSGLLRLDAAGGKLLLAAKRVLAQLRFALLLASQLGRGVAQVAGALDEAVMRVVAVAERSFDSGERRGCFGQTEVGGVVGEQAARRPRRIAGLAM